MKKEFAIGLLFLVCAATLGYVSATVQNFNPFADEFIAYVEFDRINGLKEKDGVLFEGKNIGHVKKITYNSEKRKLIVEMSLKLEGIQLPKNAIIRIEDRTILGGKQISITMPGWQSDEKAESGYSFSGENPQQFFRTASETVGKIGEGFDEIKNLLYDIRDGKGTLSKLFRDPGLYNEWEGAGREFREIGEKINRGEGTVGKLVNDTKLYDDASLFMDKLTNIHFDLTADSFNFSEDNYALTRAGVRITTDDDKFYYLGGDIYSINHETRIATPRAIADTDDTVIYPSVLIGRRFLPDNNLELAAGMIEGELGGRLNFYVNMPNTDRIGFHFETRNRIRDKDIRENNSTVMARAYIDYELRFKHFPTLRITAGAHNVFDDTQGFVGVGFEFRDDDIKYIFGAIGSGS